MVPTVAATKHYPVSVGNKLKTEKADSYGRVTTTSGFGGPKYSVYLGYES